LSYFYMSPRQASVPATVATNDQEALRLFDLAAAKEPLYAKAANELRVKLGLATATTTTPAAAPEPAPRSPDAPAPWPVREGRYTVKGKDHQGRAYQGFCTVRALGRDQYEFSWQIGGESRTAKASVRGSLVEVEVEAGSGMTRYTILNTTALTLLTSPNETLQLTLGAPSDAPTQVTERVERVDPNVRRCAQMAKSVEQFRVRAEERPQQWERPYAKAQQDYARQCPAR
jgi:hypothetical protein